jgi:hypothetical protein
LGPFGERIAVSAYSLRWSPISLAGSSRSGPIRSACDGSRRRSRTTRTSACSKRSSPACPLWATVATVGVALTSAVRAASYARRNTLGLAAANRHWPARACDVAYARRAAGSMRHPTRGMGRTCENALRDARERPHRCDLARPHRTSRCGVTSLRAMGQSVRCTPRLRLAATGARVLSVLCRCAGARWTARSGSTSSRSCARSPCRSTTSAAK